MIAPIALTQLFLPAAARARRRGTEHHFGRGGGTVRGLGGYGAAKAALEQVSNVLAAEEPAIRVWWADPGDLRTDLHQRGLPRRGHLRPSATRDRCARLPAAAHRALAERQLPAHLPRAAGAGISPRDPRRLRAARRARGAGPAGVPRPAAGRGSGMLVSRAAHPGRSPITGSPTCRGLLLPGDLLVVNHVKDHAGRWCPGPRADARISPPPCRTAPGWLSCGQPKGKISSTERAGYPARVIGLPGGAALSSSAARAPGSGGPGVGGRAAVPTAVRPSRSGTPTPARLAAARPTRRLFARHPGSAEMPSAARRSPPVVTDPRHARRADRPAHPAQPGCPPWKPTRTRTRSRTTCRRPPPAWWADMVVPRRRGSSPGHDAWSARWTRWSRPGPAAAPSALHILRGDPANRAAGGAWPAHWPARAALLALGMLAAFHDAACSAGATRPRLRRAICGASSATSTCCCRDAGPPRRPPGSAARFR